MLIAISTTRMDNPNHRVNIRRHNTAPYHRTGASRESSSLRRNARLYKLNPYIGWFRHSPPTSRSSRTCSGGPISEFKLNCHRRQEILKNSPHVGWFHHAHTKSSRHNLTMSSTLENQLRIILQAGIPKGKNILDFYLSGHLKGGGREGELTSFNPTISLENPIISSVRQTLHDSSIEGTSITVKALARLASWFLFPVAHDAESCGYSLDCSSDASSRSEGPFPLHFDLKFLDRAPFKQGNSESSDGYNSEDGAVTSDEEDDDDDEDNDSSLESSASSSIASHSQLDLAHSTSRMDLESSVSSLAEAYHAHHAAKELANHQEEIFDDFNEQNLDYVISQLDIARMARNASRHLDVRSILCLPTITYQSKRSTEARNLPISDQQEGRTTLANHKDDEGWSWMMVKTAPANHDQNRVQGQQILPPGHLDNNFGGGGAAEGADVCVICLEHFVDGDRLRVLPCNHSFHIGCIDRWLSGSQSFEECYTSGCPTCKKRPGSGNFHHHHNHHEAMQDGSVPSWAFAQVGNTLEKESGSLAL